MWKEMKEPLRMELQTLQLKVPKIEGLGKEDQEKGFLSNL